MRSHTPHQSWGKIAYSIRLILKRVDVKVSWHACTLCMKQSTSMQPAARAWSSDYIRIGRAIPISAGMRYYQQVSRCCGWALGKLFAYDGSTLLQFQYTIPPIPGLLNAKVPVFQAAFILWRVVVLFTMPCINHYSLSSSNASSAPSRIEKRTSGVVLLAKRARDHLTSSQLHGHLSKMPYHHLCTAFLIGVNERIVSHNSSEVDWLVYATIHFSL